MARNWLNSSIAFLPKTLTAWLVVCTLAWPLVGCKSDKPDDPTPTEEETEQETEDTESTDDPGATEETTTDETTEVTPEPAPTIPKVALTEPEQATVLVAAGDSFPAITLKDLGGEEKTLSGVTAGKPAIVTFVKTGDIFSEDPIRYLQEEVPTIAGDKVARVVVYVGGDADAAKETIDFLKASEGITHLIDPEGTAFSQIAKVPEGEVALPRIYVLQGDGTVAWYDLNFGPSSRRDLKTTLEVLTSGEMAE